MRANVFSLSRTIWYLFQENHTLSLGWPAFRLIFYLPPSLITPFIYSSNLLISALLVRLSGWFCPVIMCLKNQIMTWFCMISFYSLVPPPGLVRTSEGCGASMLLWSVATAIIFLLWMHSLVTSSSALTSSAVLCFTAAPGSKLKTWQWKFQPLKWWLQAAKSLN